MLYISLQESELRICVNTSTLRLPPQGVLVTWEWYWEEEDSSNESSAEEDIESQEQYNPFLRSNSESSDEFSLPSQTHTVTFCSIIW